MKKFLLSLLLLLPLGLSAQQKIGIVNTAVIMQTLPDVKAAEAKIQEQAKQFDADITKMRTEYNTKLQAFIKERDKLSEVLRNSRQQELGDIEGRIQSTYQTMQEELQKEQEKLLLPIRTKVNNAINKVCENNGCAYIFDAQAVLAVGSSAIDLTEAVKDALGIKAGAASTSAKPAAAPAKAGAKK